VVRTTLHAGPDTLSGVEQSEHYPGSRLGMPESGSGSVASWVSRFVALAIDWFTSMLVARLFFGPEVFGSGPGQFATTGVFLIESALLIALVGGSFGQLALRLAVVRLDGRPVNLLQGLLRSALVCLVIPPIVFNRDNRGLHDLAVGTVVVRR
jgi:uncharacterized RDD family membrane protein YckC